MKEEMTIEYQDKLINKENGVNLTEKRFSDLMLHCIQTRYFEKEIFDKDLYNQFYVELKCNSDRIRKLGSEHFTATYVLHVYKKYRDENKKSQLELWKTYWFCIRDVSKRQIDNLREKSKNDKEVLVRAEQKQIFKYSTIEELERVMAEVRKELFI